MNIDEIRQRLNKATPGKWRIGNGTEKDFYQSKNTVVTDKRIIVNRTIYEHGSEFDDQTYADIDFIANAKEDIKFLLDKIDRLYTERDAAVVLHKDCANELHRKQAELQRYQKLKNEGRLLELLVPFGQDGYIAYEFQEVDGSTIGVVERASLTGIIDESIIGGIKFYTYIDCDGSTGEIPVNDFFVSEDEAKEAELAKGGFEN